MGASVAEKVPVEKRYHLRQVRWLPAVNVPNKTAVSEACRTSEIFAHLALAAIAIHEASSGAIRIRVDRETHHIYLVAPPETDIAPYLKEAVTIQGRLTAEVSEVA